MEEPTHLKIHLNEHCTLPDLSRDMNTLSILDSLPEPARTPALTEFIQSYSNIPTLILHKEVYTFIDTFLQAHIFSHNLIAILLELLTMSPTDFKLMSRLQRYLTLSMGTSDVKLLRRLVLHIPVFLDCNQSDKPDPRLEVIATTLECAFRQRLFNDMAFVQEFLAQ